MALADTAKLVTELDLKDNATPGFKAAGQAATNYGAATDRAAAKTSSFSRITKGGSDALHHFGGRVSQVTQLLGAGGLLGGVLGVTVAIKHGVDAAQEWGRTTDRLRQLTGASTQEASRFSDAFDKLGIKGEQQIRIIGFMSKTLGNLAQDTKKARQMQKDYGFQLLDSNGKVKDAFTVIQDFTGYFNNKHIPAYQKASLGAKLFGRGWTDLIPIFEQGRGKMNKAMRDSMELSDQNLKDIHRYRNAQRDLNDTVGDLSVQIGLAAMPALTDLSKAASSFLEKNSWKIRDLFNQGLAAAKQFGAFMANEVLPNLGNLASAAVGFWNSIPGPLRDILVKGFVAERAIKFAFGFSITDLATGAIKDAMGGLLGRVFQRGSSPANPMYVTGSGLGGAGGAAGAAGGGMGTLGKIAAGGAIIADIAAVYTAIDQNILQPVAQHQNELMQQAMGIVGEGRDKASEDITNMTRLLKEAQGVDRVTIDTTSSKELGTALMNAAKEIVQGSTADTKGFDIDKLKAAQQQAMEHGWTTVAEAIGQDIAQLQGGGGGGKGPTMGSILEQIRQVQRESGASFLDAATVVGDRMVAAGQNIEDATTEAGKAYNAAVTRGERRDKAHQDVGGFNVTRIMEDIRQQMRETGSTLEDASTVIGDRLAKLGYDIDDSNSNMGRLFNRATGRLVRDRDRNEKQMDVLARIYREGNRRQDKGLQRAAELLKDGVTGDRENSGRVRQAIRVLEREQKQALAQHQTRLARSLGRDINVLKRTTQQGLGSATRELGNLADKPPPVVNVTTNVTSTIGVRDSDKANTVIQRYGRAVA